MATDVETRPHARAGSAAALAGAVAGLLVAALLHVLFPSFPFPPVAVADALVDSAPGAVATAAIERLGHLAQPLLVVATTVGFLGLAVALGRLLPRLTEALRGSVPAAAFLLTLPPAAVAVVAMEPSSATVGRGAYGLLLLPVLTLGAVVMGRAYRRLTAPSQEGEAHAGVDPERRLVIRAIWLGAAGLVLGWTGAALGILRRRDPGDTPLDVQVSSPVTPPPRASGDPAFDRIPGLAPRLTPLDDFYVIDTQLGDPQVDIDRWSLEVGGLVDRPFELSYDELLDLPSVEEFSTLMCISNEVGGDLISTARWTGVPLGDLLRRAGVRDGGLEVVATAVDGYADSIPIDDAMADHTLVVLGMNGRTLPTAHGYPARLLVPGRYGMKQPKWLGALEVVDRPFEGYWEQRGWSKAAIVKTMSRIDTAADQDDRLVVAGVAFSGTRGISRVEVSLDGGRTWNDAELETPLSTLTWRRWRYVFVPSADPSDVVVRGTDGEGQVQTQAVAPPHPDGSSGYHARAVG